MSPIIPTLGKDRWLTVREAERVMKEQNFLKTELGLILLTLVKAGKVRCWLCADGKLRFQHEPVEVLGAKHG